MHQNNFFCTSFMYFVVRLFCTVFVIHFNLFLCEKRFLSSGNKVFSVDVIESNVLNYRKCLAASKVKERRWKIPTKKKEKTWKWSRQIWKNKRLKNLYKIAKQPQVLPSIYFSDAQYTRNLVFLFIFFPDLL